MAYCSADDIKAEFKEIDFDASDAIVQSDDVTQWIVEADALINSSVGMKYVTPVTTAGDGLSLLRMFSRTLVRDRVRAKLNIGQVVNKDANQTVRGSGFSTKDVLDQLTLIRNDILNLGGAVLLAVGGAFASGNVDNDVQPTVFKDIQQW